MAVSAITALKLGQTLHIAFNKGLVKQLNENSADWQNIKSYSTGKLDGKQYQFMVQTAHGPAAIQYRNPTTAAFPSHQSIDFTEATVVAKELDVTMQIESNVWRRAMEAPAKYFEPLAAEVESKNIALLRRLSMDLYGDGTGVLGQVATAGLSETALSASGYIDITLDTGDTVRGFVSWFEAGDLVLCKQAGGSARSPSGGSPTGTFYAWRVDGNPARSTNVVRLYAVDSSGTVITGISASNIVATDVFYRVGQPSFVNLSSPGDYGTCSDVFVGLESLSANDGRTVHGLTMSGLLAGTRYSAGAVLDVDHLAALLDQLSLRNGGNYRYNQAMCAHEVATFLINSRETDRRFMSVEDNKKGMKGKFGYCYGNDTVIFEKSEFVKKNRIFLLPVSASGDKIIDLKLSDFTAVKSPDGPTGWMLRPNSSGHDRVLVSYMEGYLSMACRRPSAIGVLHNFTLS